MSYAYAGGVISGELDAALDACAEHDRLVRQLGRARLDEHAARQEADSAAAAVDTEVGELDQLETLSVTRIWASLRGTRSSDLDRERAELEAARYTATVAAAKLEAAKVARTRLEAGLRALGDVDARREQALANEEARLRAAGGHDAAQLVEISDQLASHRARRGEVAEALAAAGTAQRALGAAEEVLVSAVNWAGVDVFLGGGLLTDMAKYERMDTATALLRDANEALRRLSAELADVGIAAVDGVEVAGMDRTFDIWFDNIFSDWSVAKRIEDALGRVQQALRTVAAADSTLTRRLADLDAQLQTLTAAREGLLIGR